MAAFSLSLSQLLNLVQDVVDAQFYGQAYWVKCEVTDVKKYEAKNWCFCKLLEKRGGQIIAETQAVFWQQGYQHIRRFEQATGKLFENGIEVSALVVVKFTPKYGFKIEVQELDISFALGQMELARQQTLAKLILEHPGMIVEKEGQYLTPNNQLPLPKHIQRVALITANHSDGQRDFLQELTKNRLGYFFKLTGFYTIIQGETAPGLLIKQLEQIEQKAKYFDVVAMVRGGGSQTDLKPFDDYALAKKVAFFPIPIFTGIGHDRNTSITDLMARQYKVPTKVAATLVEHNLLAEQELLDFANRMENKITVIMNRKKNLLNQYKQFLQLALPNRIAIQKQKLQQWNHTIQYGTHRYLQTKKVQMPQIALRLEKASSRFLQTTQLKLQQQERMLENLSPEKVLKRGYGIVEQEGKIITDIQKMNRDLPITTRLASGKILSKILEIELDETVVLKAK